MGNCSSTKTSKPQDESGGATEKPYEKKVVDSKSQVLNNVDQQEADGNSNARQGKYIVDEKDDLIINTNLLIQKVAGTPLEKYEIVKTLGEGSYGKVFLVKHRESKLIRAMKEITRDEDTNEADIQNEINILKGLDNPHIIKIYEFFSYKAKYYLITEYCEEGELYEKINSIHQFPEDHAAYIIYQLLEAVNYCHQANIIHRDLKPENLLVEGKDKHGHFNIKVIDFGTAKVFDRSKKERKLIGSCYYIAPEVIKKNYNEKCDLWSTGIILYILLCGQAPFQGNTDQETFEKIVNSPLQFKSKHFDKVSVEAKELIKSLIDKNPKTRYSANEALLHPWFRKFKLKEKLTGVAEEKFKSFISNLKEYKPNYKLQQAALAIIVHNVPHTEEIKELERAFRKIDNNGDGKLTKTELIDGFVNLYCKSKEAASNEVEAIFKNVDNDNNGFLEYEEFIRACIDKKKLLDDKYLKFAFDFFDNDGSGQITIKELKTIFCGGGDHEVSANVMKQLVGDIDDNGDGQISFDEFCKMMRNILK